MSAASAFMKGMALESLAGSMGNDPLADPVLAMITRQMSMNSGRGQQRGQGQQRGAPVAPTGDIQRYAKQLARKEFGKGHWDDLDALVTQESSWNPKADNPTSTAYGLFQFLDSTAQNYAGKNRIINPYKQVRKGLDYIKDRYKSPTAAWDFHQENGWY